MWANQKQLSGFTIVELLIVVAVIGILAAIAIVSYSGVQNKAIAATLQSDLVSAAKQLKLYYIDHGAYPTSLDSAYCPTGVTDANYCIKASKGNSFAYQPNTANYLSYNLNGGNVNGISYRVTDNSAPAPTNMGRLDGTESWGQDGTYTNTAMFFLSTAGYHPYGANPICASFSFSPKIDSEGSNFSGSGYFEIRILKSRLATVDVAGFKTWLASNNVTVVINN